MLLVKSKELKSSVKILLKTGGYLFPPVLFSSQVSADSAASITNPTSVVSIFLSLLLVVAVIFALAYIMRRFNVTSGGSQQIKVVASLAAGTRERIMVIQVGEEQHLIGVTSQNINHLSTLAEPLASTEPSSPGQGGSLFKQKLVQAMAGKINPTINKDTPNDK
jgi:flagellar protein FliO/FliZ